VCSLTSWNLIMLRSRFLLTLCVVGLSFGSIGCNLESMKSIADPTAHAVPISPERWQEVTQSDQLTLVKFGATWCGPCVQVDEELATLDSKLGAGVGILQIDVDANEDLAMQYEITSIPRMMLVRKGEILDDRTGYASASELTDWIEQHRQ
jgi:thioredoxin 1